MSSTTYEADIPVGLLGEVGQYAGFQAPATDDSTVALRLSRDGSLRTHTLVQALALAGRVYVVNFGQGTTFVTAKTGLTAAQPDFDLDVPAGTAVIPLALSLSFGAMTGTANHFFAQRGSSVVGAGTSSAATVGPTNANQAAGLASVCTARQAYSGSGTAPVSPLELFALDDPTAATGSVPLAFAWQPPTLQPLIGPACLVGYGVSTTTALTFKAVLTYAELPASYIT